MMKTAKYLFLLLFLPVGLKSQDCPKYYPLNTGEEMEIWNYNNKKKLESKSHMVVLEGDGQSAEILSTIYNPKDEVQAELQFEVRCTDDGMLVDIASMAGPGTVSQYEGMEVDVTGDKLTLPAHAKPGDKLDEGKMTIKILADGVPLMTMEYYITDRKVESIEDVTCDLGTFSCIKISYTMEFRGILSTSMKVEEWYSPEIGYVKQATYNKKGKLQGYSLRHK